MPTWNRATVLGAAIRSVQAQTFADRKLLVVDDGSTDGTAKTMDTFLADGRVRFCLRPVRSSRPDP
jgi:glycosyltransferase involved in cell wall biosynthesis